MNKETPSVILTADWHLTEKQPPCRIDNFWQAQMKKVEEIATLQKKYDCPVICAGDLFNEWKPSPYLLTETMKILPSNFYVIYGNHDLPQHNLSLAYKNGIKTLEQAKELNIINDGVHWGNFPTKDSVFRVPHSNKTILIWHVMTWVGERPWPNCIDLNASEILQQYPSYDLIVTGHNHKSFVVEEEGRLLVNPGSLTRYKINQENHQPVVYLWYAYRNEVEPYFLPIEDNVFSREHIRVETERSSKITEAINHLKSEWKIELKLEDNLYRLEKELGIRKAVMDIVWKGIEKNGH